MQIELYGNSEHCFLASVYVLISTALYLLGELDEAWYYIQKSRKTGVKFDESSENLFQN